MKTKLSDVAHIAEIVGAAAIIVSLIFVGFQLNDNAKATRSAMANATNAAIGAWYAQVGNNAQSSSNFLHALEDPDGIAREEWYQFVLNLHGLMLMLQNSYYLNTEGTLDRDIQESLAVIIAGVKDQPGFLRYWRQRGSIFYPDFRNYVDAIIASEIEVSEGLYRNIIPGDQTEDAARDTDE